MSGSSVQPDPADYLKRAVEAAEDRKAFDVRVLDLRKVCDFTDYFLICSGSSTRQLSAVSEAVQDQLREAGVKPLHVEGGPRGRWLLLDYGDFVVHVFDQERRDYYRLEDVWSDGDDVTRAYVGEAETAAES